MTRPNHSSAKFRSAGDCVKALIGQKNTPLVWHRSLRYGQACFALRYVAVTREQKRLARFRSSARGARPRIEGKLSRSLAPLSRASVSSAGPDQRGNSESRSRNRRMGAPLDSAFGGSTDPKEAKP
jgi:hypothetical protein